LKYFETARGLERRITGLKWLLPRCWIRKAEQSGIFITDGYIALSYAWI